MTKGDNKKKYIKAMCYQKSYHGRKWHNFNHINEPTNAFGQLVTIKRNKETKIDVSIDHFTVVGLVAWPLNESEAGVDLVLIETSLLFICK